MADPVKHVTSITADSDGIYLECTCGMELATWKDPAIAPTGEIHAKVIQHGLQVLTQSLAAALAPILDPPKRRNFKLVPPGIVPQLPPGKEE